MIMLHLHVNEHNSQVITAQTRLKTAALINSLAHIFTRLWFFMVLQQNKTVLHTLESQP